MTVDPFGCGAQALYAEMVQRIEYAFSTLGHKQAGFAACACAVEIRVCLSVVVCKLHLCESMCLLPYVVKNKGGGMSHPLCAISVYSWLHRLDTLEVFLVLKAVVYASEQTTRFLLGGVVLKSVFQIRDSLVQKRIYLILADFGIF